MKSSSTCYNVEVTEENARAFYNGRLESRQPERIYQMPERSDDRPTAATPLGGVE